MNKEQITNNPYEGYENDMWYFGILLSNGKTLVIENISNVFEEYIEVIMKNKEDVDSICDTYRHNPKEYIGSFCDRRYAIVRKEHIVMIFEMADT